MIRGLAAMGLKQLMIFGKSGLQGLPTRVALPLRDIRQLRLSKGATGVPLFTICQWDSVAGPVPGNNFGKFGPGPDPGNRASVGRLGSDGFCQWVRDYGGGSG